MPWVHVTGCQRCQLVSKSCLLAHGNRIYLPRYGQSPRKEGFGLYTRRMGAGSVLGVLHIYGLFMAETDCSV